MVHDRRVTVFIDRQRGAAAQFRQPVSALAALKTVGQADAAVRNGIVVVVVMPADHVFRAVQALHQQLYLIPHIGWF